MTTDNFTEAARAEGLRLWPGTDFGHLPARFAFLDGASWARTHLAAQEPTDAEVDAARKVWEGPRWARTSSEHARAALSAAYAARRDEENR